MHPLLKSLPLYVTLAKSDGSTESQIVKNYAEKRRLEIANRVQVIAWLGMLPEGRAGDGYAASTGEMIAWLREASIGGAQ